MECRSSASNLSTIFEIDEESGCLLLGYPPIKQKNSKKSERGLRADDVNIFLEDSTIKTTSLYSTDQTNWRIIGDVALESIKEKGILKGDVTLDSKDNHREPISDHNDTVLLLKNFKIPEKITYVMCNPLGDYCESFSFGRLELSNSNDDLSATTIVIYDSLGDTSFRKKTSSGEKSSHNNLVKVLKKLESEEFVLIKSDRPLRGLPKLVFSNSCIFSNGKRHETETWLTKELDKINKKLCIFYDAKSFSIKLKIFDKDK